MSDTVNQSLVSISGETDTSVLRTEDALSALSPEAAAASPSATKRKSLVLADEESSLPEIQRLHDLFESLDIELDGIQAEKVGDEGSDSDSDDGIRTEVHQLPNSSIHDMHTIVTSEKGSRLLVTPSNRNTDLQSRQFTREPPSTQSKLETVEKSDVEREFDDAVNSFESALADVATTNPSTNSPASATPARVTFSTAKPAALSPDTPLAYPPQGGDDLNTPATPEMYHKNLHCEGVNTSSSSANKHNGFTPMTLQELMKLETPESRVDEMLQELYHLMGYYNRDTPGGDGAAFATDTGNLNNNSGGFHLDLDLSNLDSDNEEDEGEGGNGVQGHKAPNVPESSNILFASPATSPHPQRDDLPGAKTTLSRNNSASSTPLQDITLDTPEKHPRDMTDEDGRLSSRPGSALATSPPPQLSLSAPTATEPGSAVTESGGGGGDQRRSLRSASVDIDEDLRDIMQLSQRLTSSNATSASSPLDRSTFKAGWVDVSSPGRTGGGGGAFKLHESIVHGDFYIWSTGNKLTAEYINSAYVGLNRTAVTHNNDNGVLVPANLTPESTSTIPGTNVPANFGPTTGRGNKGPVLAQHASQHATASKHGYYVVHLLECVVRPDIELRDLLACVLKVARTRDCKCVFPHNNHIILKPNQQAPQVGYINPAHIHPVGENNHHTRGAGTASGALTSTSSIGELREWDQIDVQVVVSQEVKQRMLVCQFLRRVPTLTTSGFGNLNLIIYQIAGGAAPLPLLDSPKTKSFVSKLKRELTESNLCLSSLYNAAPESVCALPQQPQGLDAHFRAQLHQQVYGYMWQRLEGDISLMSEHLQAQLKECHEFLNTLLPIFKMYGLDSPLPWSSSTAHRQQLGQPLVLSNNNTTPSTSYNSNSKHSAARTPSSASTTNATSAATDESANSNMTTSTGADSTPIRAAMPISGNTPSATTSEVPMVVPSLLMTLSPKSSSPRRRLSNNSASAKGTPNKGSTSEDGMTVVLKMVNQCLQELQDSCDEEYARRVQLQNEWVVRQVDSMQDHKHGLLFALASNLDAEDAQIMRTFTSTFAGVPITIDAAGNTRPVPGSSSRSSSANHSRSSSRNPSTDNSATSGGISTTLTADNEVLVEASLYNEFRESPAPKTGNTTTATTSASTVSISARKPTATAAAPAPSSTSNWMTGLSQAFSSFTGAYSGNTATTAGTYSTSSRAASHHSHPHSHSTAEGPASGFKPRELRPKQTQEDVNRRLSGYHQGDMPAPAPSTATTTGAAGKATSADASSTGEAAESLSTVELVQSPSSPPATATAAATGTPLRGREEVESLIALTPIVLFYCSCLFSKMPGTLYITPTTICVSFTTSLLPLRHHKEIFPISALHDVHLPGDHATAASSRNSNFNHSSGAAVSVLSGNTLQLVFFKNSASSIAAATSTNKTAPATAGVASGGITAGAGAGACAGGVVNGRDLLVSPMMMDCVKLRNVILEVRSAFNL